jgi:hypothetical protein
MNINQAEKELEKVAQKWTQAHDAWFACAYDRTHGNAPSSKEEQKASDAFDRADEELTKAKQAYIEAGGSLDW